MNWAVGVTTVLKRRDKTLAETLNSLCDAGFEDVRLFVDGCDNPREYAAFERSVTCRPSPPLRIVGNFMLGLAELYVREPLADRYAMFQDDVTCVLNLRHFLEQSPYPQKGYQNLYLYKANYQHIGGKPGWHPSNQRGLGALGLVFNRDAMLALLGAGHMIRKPLEAKNQRSWKALDGGIVSGLKNAGIREFVHNPGLVQHIGEHASTLGNHGAEYQDPTPYFAGTDFDALELLK